MLVFISYPREFEAVAAALDAELRSRRIDTFLDRKSLNPTDVWRLEIESNIKKATVFVVLYSPKAAKTSRYFLIETELIQAACEQSLQRIITVIFNPTKTTDLPEFFQRRQILVSETEGTSRDERDSYWIDQIVQEVERYRRIKIIEDEEREKEAKKNNEEIEAIKKKIKRRQIIARTTLGTAGVIIVSLLYSKSPNEDPPVVANGKSLCHSLIGHYALHQKYLFTSGVDIRSIATKATWKATGCEYDERNDIYVLKGEDDTDFDIEFVTNGKYARIATATFVYPSQVTISKDGKLLGRTFAPVKTPQEVKKFYQDRDGNTLNSPESFIDEKIDEVIAIRNKTQKDPGATSCTPLLAEMGGKVAIAFVCHDYTRVMIKVS